MPTGVDYLIDSYTGQVSLQPKDGVTKSISGPVYLVSDGSTALLIGDDGKPIGVKKIYGVERAYDHNCNSYDPCWYSGVPPYDFGIHGLGMTTGNWPNRDGYTSGIRYTHVSYKQDGKVVFNDIGPGVVLTFRYSNVTGLSTYIHS